MAKFRENRRISYVMKMSCKVFDPVIIIFASSAYNINLARLLIPGKSLIYMTKSMGPNMLPCGTPYTMDSNDELEPFKETN